jgi:hypothetical protein
MEVLYYVYMKTHTYHRLVTYGNCLAMCLIIVYVCSDYGNYVYIYIPMHTHIYIDIMYTYIYIYTYMNMHAIDYYLLCAISDT